MARVIMWHNLKDGSHCASPSVAVHAQDVDADTLILVLQQGAVHSGGGDGVQVVL
jgi:hypothetical protein